MKDKQIMTALSVAVLCASTAAADEPKEQHHDAIDEIVVSATPLQRTVEKLAQPTSVLSGDALARRQSASIGETVAEQPGVTATYFGPAASRPVIRGQYGERVRVLSNGLDAMDASALSEDHAVGIDSILASRVEVIRGSATLLYGSGASGGLVNIVDSRMHPTELAAPFEGTLALGTDSAIGKQSAAVRFDAGNETFGMHVDYFSRQTDNIEIPGFAESRILHEAEGHEDEDHEEEEEAFGVIENSDSETDGGALALTVRNDNGFVGFSVSTYNNQYGVPVPHAHHDEEEAAEPGDEEDIRIDLEQVRYDIAGEQQFTGFLNKVKYRLARNEYEHVELEGDEIGTMFDTIGTDARIELLHNPIGGFEGALGFQYKMIDFVALGDEAFVPPSKTEQISLFMFEEFVASDNFTIQASARIENQQIDVPDLSNYDDTAFGASLGGIWSLGETQSLAANLSLTQRHPNSTELYADGPHLAVQRFERGSVTLGNGVLETETAKNLDLTWRGSASIFDYSLTGFINRIDDYVLLRPTAEIEDELQVYEFSQVDAELYGVEAELLVDIFDGENGHLHADFTGDFVHAEERDSGYYLPRIPPLRFGAALHYTMGQYDASVEARYYSEQDKVAPNELPTGSYTLVSAEVSGRFAADRLLVFVRGTNLGDEDARRHSSPVKDTVPLPGRSLHLGMRWDF